MGQGKQHKKCAQGVVNKLKGTHLCQKEFPIFRNGDIHFIDAVGFPHKSKSFLKPIAVECEWGSSKLQQESNKLDLLEFKKRYPEAEIFQVNDSEEVNFSKLKKFQGASLNRPVIRRF